MTLVPGIWRVGVGWCACAVSASLWEQAVTQAKLSEVLGLVDAE